MVINAVVSSGINNDPDGMREICLDSHYTVPELFVHLWGQRQILACVTIHSNHKGWDTQVMNLSKNSPGGISLVKYDSINKI